MIVHRDCTAADEAYDPSLMMRVCVNCAHPRAHPAHAFTDEFVARLPAGELRDFALFMLRSPAGSPVPSFDAWRAGDAQ